MAVSFRAKTLSGIQYGGTFTPAWPAGTTAGDVVYAVVYLSFGTITPPAGWTQVALQGTSIVYRHLYQAGDAAPSWTVSGSNVYYIDYLTLSGVDTTVFEDSTPATGYAFSVTSTLNLPTVSVASSSGGMVLYLATAPSGTNSTTSGTGLTNYDDGTNQHVLTASPSTSGVYTGPVLNFATAQSSVTFSLIAVPIRAAGVAIYQFPPTSASAASSIKPGGRLVRSPDNSKWLPELNVNPVPRSATAYAPGVSVFSRCKHYAATISTLQLNCRRQRVAMVDATDLVFIYGNVVGQEATTNLGPLTISCALEIPGQASGSTPGDGSQDPTQANGSLWRLTFAGQPTVTIQPGSYVKSDPIPLHIQKGKVYFERCYVTTTAGNQIPVQQLYPGSSRYEFADTVSTSDLTALSHQMASNNPLGMYGAQVVCGTPTGRTPVTQVVCVGDSIMEGNARGDLMSWCDQILELARIPHVKLSMQGEQNIQFFGQPGTIYDSSGRLFRGRFIMGATDMVSNSSINDITTGISTATMQGRILTGASVAAYYGARFHQATITPHTTSTDSFATVANQTPVNSAQETTRTQTNAWLRDGAPINGTTVTPVAVGDNSATTIRAGSYGHPIAGVIDVATPVETANGGGALVWALNAMTNDGLHPGDSGHNAMAAVFATYVSSHFAPYPASAGRV